ncbi:MAG: asparagine synthase-related protein, partial [Actinomycetota bacterium]
MANESITELTERFSTLLNASVKKQLLSDVPLGVLLSGGIDSGAVLRAAIAAGARDLTAYTYDMAGTAS